LDPARTAALPVSHNRAASAGSSGQTNLEVLLQLTVAELAIVVWQQTCIQTARGAASGLLRKSAGAESFHRNKTI
jgi:hypothetical protein